MKIIEQLHIDSSLKDETFDMESENNKSFKNIFQLIEIMNSTLRYFR